MQTINLYDRVDVLKFNEHNNITKTKISNEQDLVSLANING